MSDALEHTAYELISWSSDFFSNLQKLSLPDRVEGAPNYRRASLYLEMNEGLDTHERQIKSIYGTGMPSLSGLQTALDKMGANKDGSTWVYWTLMREEPVIFVRGRPVSLPTMYAYSS